jgi:hypothetical protein
MTHPENIWSCRQVFAQVSSELGRTKVHGAFIIEADSVSRNSFTYTHYSARWVSIHCPAGRAESREKDRRRLSKPPATTA